MHLLLALAFLAPPAPATAPDATRLQLSRPARVTELNTKALGGDVTRLAWSPDGTTLYLRATRTDRLGNETDHHYLVTLKSGTLTGLDVEPPWASAYWNWKSSLWSPGSATFRVEMDTKQETLEAVASPMGGSLARGGADTGASTADDIAAAARSRQDATIVRFHIGNETVGRWVNERVRPGSTFGWAPANIGVLAFADQDHDNRLVILDAAGRTQVVEGTKDIEQPAWSDDGRHLVFVQKHGRKKYLLERIDVTLP